MVRKDLHQVRCDMKNNYYTKIINNYKMYYTDLQNIFYNIPYNNKSSKLKKHFPLNCYKSFDEYVEKFSKEKNVSFSLLAGDIEQQKNVILRTIEMRYNMIKVFSNNLQYSIDYNYKLKNNYDINVIDIWSFKDDILYYNSSKDIILKFPEFKRPDNSCMFEYVYSIKTENIHHYIDLKNMKLCDRILLCISKDKSNILKLNIMFQSSTSNVYKNILSDKLRSNVKTFFDNKLFHITN